MASASKSPERILILDDEPQYLEWLFEFLRAKGYVVETCTNIDEALQKLIPKHFRLIIADLSVPVSDGMVSKLTAEGKVYLEYPGLYVAHQARNMGYRSMQVVVYSVHDMKSIQEVADRIYITYITKGRPRMLKEEIKRILSYDPQSGR